MEKRDKNGLTEKEFLKAYAGKNYPRPYLTADIVVFSENPGRVLLVKRRGHPFWGQWALPGGFADARESLLETALRELREETGIGDLPAESLEEVGIFSRPGRDPRGWVVSGAYTATVQADGVSLAAGDDAEDTAWFGVGFDENKNLVLSRLNLRLSVSDLAFDHGEILTAALKKYIYKRKEWIYV